MNRNLKGIEPIIAVVILVAVTLVLAIAVVGWIMGWWGATGGPTESLKITPINISGNNVYLYVCNTGTGKATVKEITVVGAGTQAVSGGDVDPGVCKTISAAFTGLTPGRAYDVIVSTAAGNTYKTVVRAE